MRPTAERSTNTPPSPERRRFLKRALGPAALGGVLAYAYELEPERLELVQSDLALTGWPAAVSGLRVGFISDFHCHNPRSTHRTARAVRMLLDQEPDAVFLTGDYLSHRDLRWSAAGARALAPLAAVPRGVYAVLGNHDWSSTEPDTVARHLESAGFTVLRNASVPLADVPDVWIVGLDDRTYNQQDPIQALQNVPPQAVKILLVHEPDYADEAPPGFALQLSGHSHGGQIRLPGLPPLHTPTLGRRYPEGLAHGPVHPVYTTRGVGMIGPPFRLFCPPEVTLLRLFPAKTETA